MASRRVFGQGVNLPTTATASAPATTRPRPAWAGTSGSCSRTPSTSPRGRPARGLGATLLLHSLSANYNQYSATRNQSQLGDRGPDRWSSRPRRGPDGFYKGSRRPTPSRRGPTWRGATVWTRGGQCDRLFDGRLRHVPAAGALSRPVRARFSVVGVPGTALDQLVCLRNTPVMAWGTAATSWSTSPTAGDSRRARRRRRGPPVLDVPGGGPPHAGRERRVPAGGGLPRRPPRDPQPAPGVLRRRPP